MISRRSREDLFTLRVSSRTFADQLGVAMTMLLTAHQKILFAGDSITDAGRRSLAAPYGEGYVSMVRNFVLARYPELGLTFVNRGVAGDTVRDLDARWERDVIAERPDWLAVFIGINDVWRAFGDSPHEA